MFKNIVKKTIFNLRANLVRYFWPANRYNIYKPQPLSRKFGFDRGTPIDRYWIESFVRQNSKHIRGTCLEITDSFYTQKYGTGNVVSTDILDIDTSNKNATIYGDLRNLKRISDNTYDCVILTHVLGLIDNCELAANECFRILKPGGILILTSSCLGPILGEKVFWRFTPHSIRYLFAPLFGEKNMQIETYGNALSGQYFWSGFSQEDINTKDLEYNDPQFPCIVAMIARKS